MPELPEVTVYVEALKRRVVGARIEAVRLRSPSLLKTYDPPISEAVGKRVTEVRRIGKRIVLDLEDELHLVFHLMVTGRFRWRDPGAAVTRKGGLAALDFPSGTLLLTEAGPRKQASLHLVRGDDALAAFDRGGLEPLEASFDAFREALIRENHTLKRALTDPRILSGIGNAHSDEILLGARLSPVKRTAALDDDEMRRLYDSTRASLSEWIDRRRRETGDGFPEKVTAFHPAMRAHGKYGQPCPQCGAPIQRIVYAHSETNYCANCQTGGRLLRDRALSRLLKDDWPATLEELES